MRVLRVAAPLADVKISRAAVTDTPGERLRDNEYREHNARRGVAERGKLTVADKYLVYNVVEFTHQKLKHARDRKFQHQL